MNRKHALMLSGAGVLTVALLGGGLVGISLLTNRSTQNTVSLTAAQQAEILNKVLSNNSTTAIRTPQNNGSAEAASLSARSGGGAADTALTTMPALPIQQYNYRYTEFTSQPGPKAGTCKALGENLTRTRYTAEEYTDKSTTSYYKHVNYNDSNQLLNYSLSKNLPTGSENYEYRGGQYAVRTTYTYTSPVVQPDMPTDLPAEAETPAPSDPSTGDAWKSYFGENAQIKSTVTENGKTYFVVEYSWPVDCNMPISILMLSSVRAEPSYSNNAVYVSWVDSQSYSIYKNFTYLDSVADANLVDSYVQNVEARDTDFASVANKFNFDYNVTVRNLEIKDLTSTPEQEATKTSDLIAAQKLQVLLLEHPSIKVSSVYAYDPVPAVPAGWDYAQDRKFYPAGALGDKMFNEANPPVDTNAYISALLTASAYNSDFSSYVSLETYKADKSVDEIMKSRRNEYTQTAKQDLTWKVDGQDVPVTLYTLRVKNSWGLLRAEAADAPATDSRLIAPDAMPCEGEDCYSTEKVAVFNFGGALYFATFTEGLDVNGLSFTAYDPANTAEMNTLKAKVLEMFVNNAKSVDGREAL